MNMKKRKPRLNYGMGCMMPYRYVNVKIVSVEKIGDADKYGYAKYDVAYVYAKEDYYHDVYGDEVFHQETSSHGKPYRVGKKYVWPMCIDID
jgi:hypothetical protein